MDASATLINKFKDRFPHVPAECTRVQNFDFFDRSYNGVLAIGLIFLLSTSDQVGLISSVSGALVEGGSFLFTAPEQKCSWTDVISGTKSKSLGKVHYKKLLERSGFRLNSTFSDDGGNYYYDATLD